MINLALYSVFTFIGACAPNAATLVVSRFVAGVGLGAEPPLCDAYLGELLPARHRGRYTALAYTLGFAGVPAMGWLARVLVPLSPFGVAGWRWVFVIGSLGGAIIWVLRHWLPESPRWLETAGRYDRAHQIVSAMPTDAYATGQALFALSAAGKMPPNDEAFQKGVDYLLKTQAADGTWHVQTRSIWLQPYFESGFPYGRDQFISTAGTAWAAMALATAAPPVTTSVAAKR